MLKNTNFGHHRGARERTIAQFGRMIEHILRTDCFTRMWIKSTPWWLTLESSRQWFSRSKMTSCPEMTQRLHGPHPSWSNDPVLCESYGHPMQYLNAQGSFRQENIPWIVWKVTKTSFLTLTSDGIYQHFSFCWHNEHLAKLPINFRFLLVAFNLIGHQIRVHPDVVWTVLVIDHKNIKVLTSRVL